MIVLKLEVPKCQLALSWSTVCDSCSNIFPKQEYVLYVGIKRLITHPSCTSTEYVTAVTTLFKRHGMGELTTQRASVEARDYP